MRRFCVTADTDNGAIQTGNELHLSKCRIGGTKDRIKESQQWAFCYTENLCEDDVDPPDYYIEKRCKNDSKYELFCDDTSRRYSKNDGEKEYQCIDVDETCCNDNDEEAQVF